MLNLDDPRLRLRDLLTRYEALSASKESAAPRDQSRPEVTETFDRFAQDVIRPAMEAIGAELEQRGHDYEIVIAPGQQITMSFYPVSFSSDPSTGEIHDVQSTLMPDGRGRAEAAATLSAGQVTPHWVHMQILNVLENVLETAEG